MKADKRIEELEKRVKELESRPQILVIPAQPYYPAQPFNPWPGYSPYPYPIPIVTYTTAGDTIPVRFSTRVYG